MRVPRIYTVNTTLQVGQMLQLDREASNHVSRVLRLKAGHPVTLFNGDGYDYQAVIETLDRNQVGVHIQNREAKDLESPLHIHLYQGVSRGDKMDLTLQKGVELGIKEFTPLITERCGVKLDDKRWQKKYQHWVKVIQSACEQCGRTQIPRLNDRISFAGALSNIDKQSFFLHPEAATAFKNLESINTQQAIALWVGPEGGFSDNEVQQISSQEVTPVQLGPRILRTETAALAAVSVINSVWGDF